MSCARCAVELETGARFCGNCGMRVGPVASGDPSVVVNLEAELEPAAAPAAAAPSSSSPAGSPSGPAGPAPDLRASLRNRLALDRTMLAPANSVQRTTAAATATATATATGPAAKPENPLASPGGGRAALPSLFFGADGSAAKAAASLPADQQNNGSRDDMVGRTLNNRYVVGDKVGEGGFGAVFRGRQVSTGREVALKILHPHNLGDATIVARFRREAEACSRLRNPHAVITYDFDETEDGVLYLAMELLRGRSLHQLQRSEGKLQPDRVLRIIDQVADALGEAHQNGIIHRDMKPENVFIERRAGEDHVKVLDFGIAKMLSDDRGQVALTAVGQTLGTLEFMSPEQLRGQSLDGRSDIYALGIMAYEMLTGDLPFKNAKNPVDIINFHLQTKAVAPSRMRPELNLPTYVDDVILKMVAKSPEERHASTTALRAHIAQVLARKGSRAPAARIEAYRVIGVIAAGLMIVSGLVYFLSR
jgi:tRNA A-37 threonylcarbamoyl transferase component Bud32